MTDTKIDKYLENRNFSHVYTGVKIIPDNLARFRVTGKNIVPYTSSIKHSNIAKKTAQWAEEGLCFIEIKKQN